MKNYRERIEERLENYQENGGKIKSLRESREKRLRARESFTVLILMHFVNLYIYINIFGHPKVAGQVLESVNFGAYSGSSKPLLSIEEDGATAEGPVASPPPGHSQPSSVSSSNNGAENPSGPTQTLGHWPLASHRPFLQLVLMCLDGQDDQLSELLESLRTQLTQSLFYTREVRQNGYCIGYKIIKINEDSTLNTFYIEIYPYVLLLIFSLWYRKSQVLFR